MAVSPEIRISGEKVAVRVGRKKLVDASLEQFVRAIDLAGDSDEGGFEIRPKGVRMWAQRRDAVAVALEIPPHARTVRWLADDSKAPFGRGASYEQYFVGFPWIVVLLVFRGGALTGQQQLYYRLDSLDTGDELLLPNLYNVATGYGQQCWLCLQNVPDLTPLPWHEKLARIVDHTFSAGFNKSAEEHEGNSYWSTHAAVDERLASMASWQQASRDNRRFALEVPWRPAGTTARAELRKMLDQVVRPRRVQNSAELVGLLNAAHAQRELL
jgi:hypothetical protein